MVLKVCSLDQQHKRHLRPTPYLLKHTSWSRAISFFKKGLLVILKLTSLGTTALKQHSSHLDYHMVYALTHIFHDAVELKDSKDRKENLMMSYTFSTSKLNLYSKSNWKPLKVHNHGLREHVWSMLRLLLNLHTISLLSLSFLHTSHSSSLKPAQNTPTQTFSFAIPSSWQVFPSLPVIGHGHVARLIPTHTTQPNGHFLREVFPSSRT